MATGVLILCLGKFTRLSQFVTTSDKRYRAEVTFGIETDSHDADGEVVAQNDRVPDLIDDISPILKAFLGKSLQKPPMHSAIRVGGKRLYELAREGKEVERPAREIEIFSLDVVSYHKPKLVFDVWCSKGTYIRSLASDLGKRMGCGAFLSRLERTAIGPVALSQCYSLDALRESVTTQEPVSLLDTAFVLGLAERTLTDEQLKAFVNGNAVTTSTCAHVLDQDVCVCDSENLFIGIGRYQQDGLRPVRVLARRES